MNADFIKAADELEALLPDLEFSRTTHVQWRDCDQCWRDKNPSIGDAGFHDQCVRDYDLRISTIKKAVAVLRSAA